MIDEYTPDLEASHDLNLTPSADVLQALSTLLDEPQEILQEALKQSRSESGYERYEYPKGNGKVRVIHAPAAELKQIQRALLDQLLNQVSVTPFAHGFVPHRSIITNALVHAPSARHILSVDLKDAFPSVSEARVSSVITWRVGRLIKINAPQLSAEDRGVACQLIAQLCTRDGALPQGAPTSGYLLNLTCARLDRLIYAVALRSRLPQLKYTRYADDLTLTSSGPIPPEFIAQVKRAITRAGFTINPYKIHAYSDQQKSIVICGIRLHNQRLALPKATLKRYRAHIDQVAQKTVDQIDQRERAQLIGVLSFLRSIYPTPPRTLIKPLQRLLDAHSGWIKAPKPKEIPRFIHYTYQGRG